MDFPTTIKECVDDEVYLQDLGLFSECKSLDTIMSKWLESNNKLEYCETVKGSYMYELVEEAIKQATVNAVEVSLKSDDPWCDAGDLGLLDLDQWRN